MGAQPALKLELYDDLYPDKKELVYGDSSYTIPHQNFKTQPRDQRSGIIKFEDVIGKNNNKPTILGPDGNLYKNNISYQKMGGGLNKATGESKIGYNKRNGYPFIDFKDLSKNWYKIPFHYGMRELFSLYTTPPEDRHTLSSKIVGGFADFQKKYHGQKLSAELIDSFPKIVVWSDFAKSPSIIDEVYMVQIGNKEMPAYMRAKNGPAATDDAIAEGIRFIRDKKSVRNKTQSPYNTNEPPHRIDEFFRDGFARLAADKFSRGDYETFIDPGRFNPWFIRDDTWHIQEYGKKIMDKTLNVDGTNYTIKGYEKPDKFNTWAYWFIGDQVYDFIDRFFDPIQRVAERLFSTEAQQDFVKNEYKMIAGIRRSIFDNPARLDLAYEI